MTRTSDLFRVKEVRSITYRWSSMKTRNLRTGDLDLKWTAERVFCWFGPHTDLVHSHTPQQFPGDSIALARSPASFRCCGITTTNDVLIRMGTSVPSSASVKRVL